MDFCQGRQAQEEYAKDWFQNRFKRSKAHSLEIWEDLCVNQFALIDADESNDDRTSILEEYATFIEAIWPKYLQLALTEMTNSLRLQRRELDPSEFDGLPESNFDNLTEQSVFDDFLS